MIRKIPAVRHKRTSKFDLFFSKSMELTPVVKAFCCYFIPEDFSADARPDTLARIDRVHTNAKLEQRRRDIAYEMDAGRLGKLLLCFEHQSSPDKLMIARELYYAVDNIAAYLAEGELVPTILNFVVYHGKSSPQPYPIHPEECFECPEVAMQYLNFKFIFIDLNRYSDAELLQTGHCAIMLLLLKHGRDGNFELEPKAYRTTFEETIAVLSDDYIYSMLQCAESLSNEEAGRKTYKFIEEVLITKTDTIMTYGARIRQEAKQESLFNVARTMLQDRTPVGKVSKWTGLDTTFLNTILQEVTPKSKRS